ncbi:Mov34/MPN/PAD-1 family protein [Microbulbifer rhizosphaerae]|uniref:Integrative and conjugative element protein (TIGR02256 family) n=1 Tax=Microbulbifer rhizosphaerae TaxID=1562603 RepID=A0A7W4WA99_9GAMM|nr:Mov34/MPN/PAD-1 family protein [Microbulbifer rhizosphaerae]MBB3060067.1 integrative and conjugative element protein (TIGR02256 family) [Microbulbifer rhizosphaerae]
MQFMSSWTTNDKRTLLHFSTATLETFCQHIQNNDTDCEAGGLLLGSVHGTHMLIEQATAPTALDKRFPYLFERMLFGHEAIAMSRWVMSQGTVRYLGEWHTHPEDHPHPSVLDRSEWNRLSAKRQDKRLMLAAIVGRKSLYVELVPSSGRGSVLDPIE